MDKSNKKKRKIHIIVFIVYLAFLIYFLFFSDLLGRKIIYDEYRYNIKPFREIERYFNYAKDGGWLPFLVNVVGNIIMFAPFGYLFTALMEKKQTTVITGFIDTFLITLVLCLLVELCQLLSKVGVFDVDDIILNVFGSLLGFVLHIPAGCSRGQFRGRSQRVRGVSERKKK